MKPDRLYDFPNNNECLRERIKKMRERRYPSKNKIATRKKARKRDGNVNA